MRRILVSFLATAAMTLFGDFASAEVVSDGAVDLAFDAGGFTNGEVNDSRIQPDGKIIIAGSFTKVHGVPRIDLARLNADGTVDESFVPWSGTSGTIQGLELLSDNRLLVWGDFLAHAPYDYKPYRAPQIVRLNSDGSLDAAFDVGRRIANTIGYDNAGVTDPGWIANVLVQPDGKIVIIGGFAYIYTAPETYVARSCVARFHADGSLDDSFNPGAGAQIAGDRPAVMDVARQNVGHNDGKLLLYGYFDAFNGHSSERFVRLNSDGSVDESFSFTTSSVPHAWGLLVLPDDRILVFGASKAEGTSPITRLEPDGDSDAAFGAPAMWRGYTAGGAVNSVALQTDGKLLVVGAFHSIDGAPAHNVVRLGSDGALDPSFDASVATGPHADSVRTVLVRPDDGMVFLGGDFSTFGGAPRHNFAWANADGSLAQTFAGLAGAIDGDPTVDAIATQPNGKVIVGGKFTSVGGRPRYSLVRLNDDASVDTSFNPDAGTTGRVYAVLLQPDGKILVGGAMDGVNGVARRNVARFNADGTLDTSFDPGAGPDNTVQALAVDAAGNVYVGGIFTNFDGQPRKGIAKLSPTGALDTSFNPGLGADGAVRQIALAPESNAIVIAGTFPYYDGVAVGRIARIDAATAALDTTFNSGGTGFHRNVTSLVRSSEGKYYVATAFGVYNLAYSRKILRLNADGTVDDSFLAAPPMTVVHELALRADHVYAAGQWHDWTAARLTSTGAYDGNFSGGVGARTSGNRYFSSPGGSPIASLALQPDGKLLVGGSFTSYNNVERVCLVRLTDSKLNFTAASRKTHGTAGSSFDLNLPLAGAPATESRTGGPAGVHQLVLSFAGPVTVESASVSSGVGAVSNVSGSGTSIITVDLTGVLNGQRIAVQLSNVGTGTSVTDLSLTMGLLVGDSNGDGTVNSGDSLQTRNRSGQRTDISNFRSDFNLDGFVNSGDASVVRGRSGQSIP